MLTAEAVLALIDLTGKIITMYKSKAKFADGTVLTQEHIDAAKQKADAPWGRIEDRAQAELDALDKKQHGGTE
jgi:hypothetical protein